eukprot:754563-Hanusia_phi.AAC.6
MDRPWQFGLKCPHTNHRVVLRLRGGILLHSPKPEESRGRRVSVKYEGLSSQTNDSPAPARRQRDVKQDRYPKSIQKEMNRIKSDEPKQSMKKTSVPDEFAGFGEVVTVEPSGDHTATVIWLHGLGDTGHTWSAVASWLQMPWCKFIFPTAPAQPVRASGLGCSMQTDSVSVRSR